MHKAHILDSPVVIECIGRSPARPVLRQMTLYIPVNGPAGYAEDFCRRMSEVGGVDWRVCNPQPSAEGV